MFKYLSILYILIFRSYIICEVLTLNDYCKIFNERNNEIKSLEANILSIESKLAEIDRIYSYYFTAGTNYLNDQTGQELYLINIDKLLTTTYSASLNKQFRIGTYLSFGVGGFYGDYSGYKTFDDPEKIRYNDHRLYPFIHLHQSLLKNIKGTSTKTSIAKQKAQIKSSLYLLEYKKQALLFNAKLSYWKLSYAKTVTKFRTMSLERTMKFLTYNFKKYKLNLIDESDLLQAQAAVKLKELSLNLAIEEQTKAQVELTQLLNLETYQEYEVENIDDKVLNLIKIEKLKRKNQRLDVLSALEDVKSATYDELIYKKSSGADLVLDGQASLSNVYRSIRASTTTINTSKNDAPTFSFGIKYVLPLDFKLRKIIHKGYNAAKIAAEKTAKQLQSKEDSNWNLLVEHFNNVKSRLQIAYEIKKIQQRRTIKNKSNLQKGKGSTYFVLQSEQDLDDIELNIFQYILELIAIQEQANIFYS
ncbi:MAG: TolC family protein [Endomicrobium sp.]|jgi:outer membrane protein TolC|nr:TolC family protein [Endomicrobium sp.]